MSGNKIVVIICIAIAVLLVIIAIVAVTTGSASASGAETISQAITIICRWPLQPTFYRLPNGTMAGRCTYVWYPG
jgi:hypothetical protein